MERYVSRLVTNLLFVLRFQLVYYTKAEATTDLE